MKSIQRITGIVLAAIAILGLSGTAGFAGFATQSSFQNSTVILLTENHARTVAFDLNEINGGSASLHSLYILSFILGDATGGILRITLNYNSPLVKGDEVIYFVTGGLLGTKPILNYIYATGGTFSTTVAVPKVSLGALFFGVVYATGVDFPVTLRATVSLAPLAAAAVAAK